MNACTPSLHRAAGESRKTFNFRVLHRCAGYDALVAQVSGVVEGAGVAVITWRDERCPKSNAFAVRQQTHLIQGIAAVILINAKPYSFGDVRSLSVGINLLGLDINTLPKRVLTFGLNFSFGNYVCRDQHLTVAEPKRLFGCRVLSQLKA
jgi:hypothetical protein